MPSTKPGRKNGKIYTNWLSFQTAKIAAGLLLFLLLFYLGFQGKQRAERQAALREIVLNCDRLQSQLDESWPAINPVSGDSRHDALELGPSQVSKADLATSIARLKSQLAKFSARFSTNTLGGVEDLDLRTGQAVLANAEKRFDAALRILSDEDESRIEERTAEEDSSDRAARVLRIRGDAFYGMQNWRRASERYRRYLTIRTNRFPVMARLADCRHALGNTDEALTRYRNLAAQGNRLGDSLLIQGQLKEAIERFETCVEILNRLVEDLEQRQLEPDLAVCLNNLGNAFLVQERPETAIGLFGKAADIQNRLVQQGGGHNFETRLAASCHHLGNALLLHGKPESAIEFYSKSIDLLAALLQENDNDRLAKEWADSLCNRGNAYLSRGMLNSAVGDYDRAIDIRSRLAQRLGDRELDGDLALSHNNRGVARRAQGNLDDGIEDFEKTIEILNRLVLEKNPDPASTAANIETDGLSLSNVKLEVAMNFNESAVEVQRRARPAGPLKRDHLEIALTTGLKNKGFSLLQQGNAVEAAAVLKVAVEIYARLVEQENRRDLIGPFVKNLVALAWIHAASPDASARDGVKAEAYALKACELSDWRELAPVESLAAACAESGKTADAVRWQEKALELAPRDRTMELLSRLELYRSGKAHYDSSKSK